MTSLREQIAQRKLAKKYVEQYRLFHEGLKNGYKQKTA
jgi:hypothetical protein